MPRDPEPVVPALHLSGDPCIPATARHMAKGMTGPRRFDGLSQAMPDKGVEAILAKGAP